MPLTEMEFTDIILLMSKKEIKLLKGHFRTANNAQRSLQEYLEKMKEKYFTQLKTI